jgi:integrase/recombinase XerD
MSNLQLETNARAIKGQDVTKLLDYLAQNDYAIQTRKGYISALRRYCRDFDNKYMGGWPKTRFPHDDRPHADWLEANQAHDLLTADKTPLQEIVIHLELCLGLRRVEVIRLRTADIDGMTRTLLVRGKGGEGGKPRTIPYARGTEDAIEAWAAKREAMREAAKKRRPATFEDPAEFIVWARAGRLYAYSEEGYGLDKVVTIPLSKQLGFHFSNHTLRRTFGRALFRSGVPVPTIAKILGHESTDVTLRYIGVCLDDMRAALDRRLYA